MNKISLTVIAASTLALGGCELGYPIVDTGQLSCYDDTAVIDCPAAGQAFFGQDAQYAGHAPDYTDNGDGTITDNVTGLMWQRAPGAKVTWEQAVAGAAQLNLGGYSDWRLPTIKELYSLIDFNGTTASGDYFSAPPADAVPYIDTDYFDFSYGDTSAGERYIDAQYWSATEYVSTTMGGDATVFGVNFADGRIKGYPKLQPQSGSAQAMFVLYVRDNPDYGNNQFVDNGDGTIADLATGLTWMQGDSASLGADADGKLDWQAALSWCEGSTHAGFDDWRLPNAKELQSLVDYSRSPDTSASAAIDPLFTVTPITDEVGGTDYPYYWSSTTHLESLQHGTYAAYVSFGRALGFLEMPPGSASYQLLDVHGAGAQRSDPKSGDVTQYPYGHGPQGDVIRIDNMARCVRTG